MFGKHSNIGFQNSYLFANSSCIVYSWPLLAGCIIFIAMVIIINNNYENAIM